MRLLVGSSQRVALAVVIVFSALVLAACGGGETISGEAIGTQPMFKGELTKAQVDTVLKKGAEINDRELQSEERLTDSGVLQAQRMLQKVGRRATVYRFYNSQTGTHFYTSSEIEKAWVRE